LVKVIGNISKQKIFFLFFILLLLQRRNIPADTNKTTMIHLKPTDLIAVPVPPDSYNEEIVSLSNMSNTILRWKEKRYNHYPDVFHDFIDLPENRAGYTLLGTVTENDIDFDPPLDDFIHEKYCQEKGTRICFDSCQGNCYANIDQTEEFKTLLKANGLHFSEPPVIAYEQGKVPLSAQIQSLPLVKKLLILKPI